VSAVRGKTRCLRPLPQTRRWASESTRSSIWSWRTSQRTQPVLQHEGDDGEIAEGAKAFPKASHLVGGERHDHAARLTQS
jgi:hypothetical protein